MGKASVTYELGVFERGREEVRAVGGFVHVFVERESGRTVEAGIEGVARDGLERILVKGEDDGEMVKGTAKL